MKINVASTDKLTAAIAAVEGSRVSARTITSEDVTKAVAQIEKRLSGMMLKKDWAGAAFCVDVHAQDFPNAYKGRPESTIFTVQRFASGWFVTDIRRGYTRSANNRIAPHRNTLNADAIVAYATGAAWH